jgi:serine/threonine protein kinase
MQCALSNVVRLYFYSKENTCDSTMAGEKGPIFPPNTIIKGRFKLLEKIGHGSFGVVFRGVDMENSNSPVALKLERAGYNKSRIMLENEYKAYCRLNGGPGIPKVCYCKP